MKSSLLKQQSAKRRRVENDNGSVIDLTDDTAEVDATKEESGVTGVSRDDNISEKNKKLEKDDENNNKDIPDPIIPQEVSIQSQWSISKNCMLVRKPALNAHTKTAASFFQPRKNNSTSMNNAASSQKVAAFDLDGTLLLWKCAGWPSKLEHYELWNMALIDKIRALYDKDKYKLVIFSNQGGIRNALQGKTAARFRSLIDWLASVIDRPLYAICSTKKDSGFHKPNVGMWLEMEDKCNNAVQISPELSFYVGDSTDTNVDDPQGGVDSKFARNVGAMRNATMTFYTPDEYFGVSDMARRKERANANISMESYVSPPIDALRNRMKLLGGYLEGPVLVILCGVQGSGKSTFCSSLLQASTGGSTSGRIHWVHFSQDTIHNGKPGKREAVEKAAFEALMRGQSVLVDRMHLDEEQRSFFIQVAKQANVPAHAVLLNPPQHVVEERVKNRTNHPAGVQGDKGARIAVSSLDRLQPPKYSEGLHLITFCSTNDSAVLLSAKYTRVISPPTGKNHHEEENLILPSPVLQSSFTMNRHNDFLSLPSIALGTMDIGKKAAASVVKSAMCAGIKAVDTAPTYKNELEIGTGLDECYSSNQNGASSQKQCFLICKIPKRVTQPQQVCEELQNSLSNLGSNSKSITTPAVVDLLLLHWPCDVIEADTLQATWQEMEKLKSQGLCRSLGVCNFSVDALRLLLPTCTIRPAVNQIERHPLLPQWELVDFCAMNDILVQAHTPLGHGKEELLRHCTITDIAEETELSAAQVILQWNICHGISVVTKCSSYHHQREVVDLLKQDSRPHLLSSRHMEAIDEIGMKSPAPLRIVSPPFMYKKGAVYSWGDKRPS